MYVYYMGCVEHKKCVILKYLVLNRWNWKVRYRLTPFLMFNLFYSLSRLSYQNMQTLHSRVSIILMYIFCFCRGSGFIFKRFGLFAALAVGGGLILLQVIRKLTVYLDIYLPYLIFCLIIPWHVGLYISAACISLCLF